jgi:hypothetical protein
MLVLFVFGVTATHGAMRQMLQRRDANIFSRKQRAGYVRGTIVCKNSMKSAGKSFSVGDDSAGGIKSKSLCIIIMREALLLTNAWEWKGIRLHVALLELRTYPLPFLFASLWISCGLDNCLLLTRMLLTMLKEKTLSASCSLEAGHLDRFLISKRP